MDTLSNTLYLWTGIVLAVLLITSEIIGWTKCVSNSITEYLYIKLMCKTNTRPITAEESEGELFQERRETPT